MTHSPAALPASDAAITECVAAINHAGLMLRAACAALGQHDMVRDLDKMLADLTTRAGRETARRTAASPSWQDALWPPKQKGIAQAVCYARLWLQLAIEDLRGLAGDRYPDRSVEEWRQICLTSVELVVAHLAPTIPPPGAAAPGH